MAARYKDLRKERRRKILGRIGLVIFGLFLFGCGIGIIPAFIIAIGAWKDVASPLLGSLLLVFLPLVIAFGSVLFYFLKDKV